MIHSGTLYFEASDPIFSEHFPGAPVVPASLIVSGLLTAARRHGFKPASAVEDFRFRLRLSPGRYSYAINEEGGWLNCRITAADQLAVSGKVRLCGC